MDNGPPVVTIDQSGVEILGSPDKSVAEYHNTTSAPLFTVSQNDSTSEINIGSDEAFSTTKGYSRICTDKICTCVVRSTCCR